jgi:dihydrofolate reductase
MGRGTWDSLPVKPLPDRTNIIMTHRHDVPLDHPYVECAAGSLSITIGYQRALDPEVPIWVIGGAVLLEEALELRDTDTVIETVIDGYDHRYVHSDHAVYFRPNLYRNKAWRKVDETSRWLWDRNKGKPPASAVPSKDAGYYRVTEYCYRKR